MINKNPRRRQVNSEDLEIKALVVISETILLNANDKKHEILKSVRRKRKNVGGNAIIEIATGAQAFNLAGLGYVAAGVPRVMHRGCNGTCAIASRSSAHQTLRFSDNETVMRFIWLRVEMLFLFLFSFLISALFRAL